MTESMMVEAVRALGGPGSIDMQGAGAGAAQAVADPSAVQRFQSAMGVEDPSRADPIPFVSQASAAWREAHANNQGLLHRIRALSDMKAMHQPSAAQLVELQYEVANLAFQQEIVTKVAAQTSTAIQTLVKNQ